MKKLVFGKRKAKDEGIEPEKQESIVVAEKIEGIENKGTIERIQKPGTIVRLQKSGTVEWVSRNHEVDTEKEAKAAKVVNEKEMDDEVEQAKTLEKDDETEHLNIEENEEQIEQLKDQMKQKENADNTENVAMIQGSDHKSEDLNTEESQKEGSYKESSHIEKSTQLIVAADASDTKLESKKKKAFTLHLKRSSSGHSKEKKKFNLGQSLKANWKSVAFVAILLILSFFMGRGIAVQREKIVESNATAQKSNDWGLGFGAEGAQPTGNGTPDEMKQYDAYYVGDNNNKVMYLTFDCGYENGNTPAILDALKKHNAPATFFVVGNFLNDNPDLIKQMVADGHMVGNHTMHHRDVSVMQKEEFSKEIKDVEDKYKEITGQDMVKLYRAPQGKYSIENLKMAKDLGYKTIFWSLAYVDWNQDSQPTKEQAFEKLIPRSHSGAVVLLHNTSKTNGQIMDELLSKWEEMGYQFKPLNELWDNAAGQTTPNQNTEQNTEQNNDQNTNQNMDQKENQSIAPDSKDTPSAETSAVIQEI